MQGLTDSSIELPSFEQIFAVLTLQAGYNSALVVIGTTLLGCAAGIVGTFALLRRRAMMADALAHAALPGIAATFIISVFLGSTAKSLPVLLFGALISGIIGVLTVQFLVTKTRIKEDAAIGIVLSVFFGLGVTLLSLIQTLGTGQEAGLQHFIYGQTAAITRDDAYLALSITAAALIAAFLLIKEFKLLCFDDQFAAVQGWPIGRLDLLLMSLVIAVTIIGLQAVGLILIVALLIIPPAAARFWTERFSTLTGLSALFGALGGYIGSSASALLPRLPTGAVIVLVSGLLFFCSFLFAPRRGTFAAALRRIGLQLRVAEEHLLRRIFESSEKNDAQAQSISLSGYSLWRGWGPLFRFFIRVRLRRKGLAYILGGDAITLTARGRSRGADLTRNHRLWEQYLLTHAHLAQSHVDRSADYVEHVLSADMIAELEAALLAKGALQPDVAPTSPHPIEEG